MNKIITKTVQTLKSGDMSLYKHLSKLKWSWTLNTEGASRRVYHKTGLNFVIKVLYDEESFGNQSLREYDRYKKYRGTHKALAKIYWYGKIKNRYVIIMEKVGPPHKYFDDGDTPREVLRTANSLNVCELGYGYKNGVVKIFDYGI